MGPRRKFLVRVRSFQLCTASRSRRRQPSVQMSLLAYAGRELTRPSSSDAPDAVVGPVAESSLDEVYVCTYCPSSLADLPTRSDATEAEKRQSLQDRSQNADSVEHVSSDGVIEYVSLTAFSVGG